MSQPSSHLPILALLSNSPTHPPATARTLLIPFPSQTRTICSHDTIWIYLRVLEAKLPGGPYNGSGGWQKETVQRVCGGFGAVTHAAQHIETALARKTQSLKFKSWSLNQKELVLRVTVKWHRVCQIAIISLGLPIHPPCLSVAHCVCSGCSTF
jgi:hypothetical protein